MCDICDFLNRDSDSPHSTDSIDTLPRKSSVKNDLLNAILPYRDAVRPLIERKNNLIQYTDVGSWFAGLCIYPDKIPVLDAFIRDEL